MNDVFPLSDPCCCHLSGPHVMTSPSLCLACASWYHCHWNGWVVVVSDHARVGKSRPVVAGFWTFVQAGSWTSYGGEEEEGRQVGCHA